MLSALTMFLNATANSSNGTGGLTSAAANPSVSLLYSTIESFLFPFLLVFAIVYGVLERSKIFEGKRDVESIIAFVMAIVFATTSYTLNLTYIILPIAGVVAIVIFMLLVLASMVYGESNTFPAAGKKIIIILAAAISIVLVLWVLLTANFGFAGITQQALVGGLTTYGPYIAVLIFLLVAGYLLSK
jgi:small-conductance mechanosensitive channel